MNILERAGQIRSEIEKELQSIKPDLQAIEDLRIKYLGKKGLVTALFRDFGALPPELKKDAGQIVNQLKQFATETVEGLKDQAGASASAADDFDYSLPGYLPETGRLHPISITMREIIGSLQQLGFTVEYGPEVETDYNNFQALNFPANHPARDMQDTFFISKDTLLRTHTSPIQVRTMQKYDVPIRMLAPGRVYRNEAINSRSYCVFHQIEGLYIDEGVTFADLKSTLDIFIKSYFGKDVRSRFRPSYFPFTEPSAEVDISCFICGGEGCRVCKHTGWLEILGCGMVDPNVLIESKIDPEKYSGFAFGMGAERIAMLKYGIDDIRLLYEGDVRFLTQFF